MIRLYDTTYNLWLWQLSPVMQGLIIVFLCGPMLCTLIGVVWTSSPQTGFQVSSKALLDRSHLPAYIFWIPPCYPLAILVSYRDVWWLVLVVASMWSWYVLLRIGLRAVRRQDALLHLLVLVVQVVVGIIVFFVWSTPRNWPLFD